VGSREAVVVIKRKAKGKAKGKRKKAPIAKTRKNIKKRAKQALPWLASPKKATPPTTAARNPTPINEQAPKAGRPPPHRPIEQRIGVVTHYYGYRPVAAIRLEPGATLRIGDVIHIRGHTTNFTQQVESLEVNRAPVTEVGPNDNFGLRVVKHVYEHDAIFKVL